MQTRNPRLTSHSISRDRLPWKAPFQPYLAWVGGIAFMILLLTGGYTTFVHGHWDTETFVSSYINIPLWIAFYVGYKYIKKTKFISLEDVPVMKFIEVAERNPEPVAPKPTGWRRFNILWS